MSLYKQTKDQFIKFVLGKSSVPSGLADLHHYFRVYEPIRFFTEQQEDGSLVAVSQNYQYGSIITHAQNSNELSDKIKDAILTAFEVPSSYSKEAAIQRMGDQEYAFA